MLGVVFLFVFVATALPLSVDVFVVVAHECEQPFGFDSVGADVFVYLNLFFFDEVEGVVAADGEEVGYFGFVFAPVDVEDEFFFAEDVGVVEGAAGLLLLGSQLKHPAIITITRCKYDPFMSRLLY